jgi:hypothetical protein
MRALAADSKIGVGLGSDAEPLHRSFSQLVFSFPLMLAATLIVLTVLTARGRFYDPDLWWHLKTGEVISGTHSIPREDLFSFSTNNHSWIAHEWLSEVSMYGAWKLGGDMGLMFWLCGSFSALLIVAYALCAQYSGNSKVALVGAMVTWFFATVGVAIRPHLVGYLLLTCELLIVHMGRSRSPRWFLLLPPLFAVWVNCHGSFFFGILALGIFLFGSFWELRWGSLVSHRWERSRRNIFAIAFATSVAALLINPSGLKQVTYPLDLMFNQSTNLQAVDEWQPLTFDNARAVGLLAVAGFVFLSALIRRAELRLEELLLLTLGFGLAVRHNRMVFVFGVLAAPIICRLLSNDWDNYEPARDRRTPNAIMLLVSLIAVIFAFPTSTELQQQVDKNNPVKAVEFIRKADLSGEMLNDYAFGGYLIWSLPEHKVFVDGRTDIYDWTGVLDEYGAWATFRRDPKELLDKYHIGFCLLSRTAPMTRVLPYLPGWKMIYSDELSIIFVRST